MKIVQNNVLKKMLTYISLKDARNTTLCII